MQVQVKDIRALVETFASGHSMRVDARVTELQEERTCLRMKIFHDRALLKYEIFHCIMCAESNIIGPKAYAPQDSKIIVLLLSLAVI